MKAVYMANIGPDCVPGMSSAEYQEALYYTWDTGQPAAKKHLAANFDDEVRPNITLGQTPTDISHFAKFDSHTAQTGLASHLRVWEHRVRCKALPLMLLNMLMRLGSMSARPVLAISQCPLSRCCLSTDSPSQTLDCDFAAQQCTHGNASWLLVHCYAVNVSHVHIAARWLC